MEDSTFQPTVKKIRTGGAAPINISDPAQTLVQFRVHNVRFYNLPPVSIKCMAHNDRTKKLALARGDAAIEIWDVHYLPCLEYVVPTRDVNIDALGWCGDRLLSGGRAGQLMEWDLQGMCIKQEVNVLGTGIFCIDVNKQQTNVVVGTRGGYMTALSGEYDILEFSHMFDHQEDDILCCKFSHDGEFVVSGSIAVIRLFNYKSGQAIARMAVTHSRPNEEVRVWSVAILNDLTIVAGDSLGQLSFWEGTTGVHLETHQASKVDILTIDVSNDEKIVCAGIDPVARIFQKTYKKVDDQRLACWVKVLQRAADTHDILNLLIVDTNIYCTGVSGYLSVSSLLKNKPEIGKHGPFLKNPCVTTSGPKSLILLRNRYYMQVWRLNELPKMQRKSLETLLFVDKHVDTLPVSSQPKPLVTIKSKDRFTVMCSAISHDGNYICYSTIEKVVLLRMDLVGDRAELTPFDNATLTQEIATHLAFCSDRLFVVNPITKKITIYKILSNADQDIELCQTINISKIARRGVKLFTVSPDGAYLGIVTTKNIASVWQCDDRGMYSYLVSAPQNEAAISAFAIQSKSKKLVLAYTNNHLVEYDLDEMYNTLSITCNFSADIHCISSILIDENDETLLYIHNDKYLYVLEKREYYGDVVPAPSSKKQRQSEEEMTVQCMHFELTYKREFCHLACIDWLKPDELVAIIIDPLALMEGMPSAYAAKKFGTS